MASKQIQKEWDGKQRLVKPCAVRSLPWVDIFERTKNDFVIWVAAKPAKGRTIETVEIIGSFRDRANAKVIADTVLSVVRPELKLMPVLNEYTIFKELKDLIHVVAHQADAVPRRCPDCEKVQSTTKPLTTTEQNRLTEYVAGLDKNVQSWRVTTHQTGDDDEIIPAMTRHLAGKAIARVPVHPAVLAEKTIPVHLCGSVHNVPLKTAPLDDWANYSAVDPKTLAAIKAAMTYCDLKLKKEHGDKLLNPKDFFLVEEMQRVGEQVKAVQRSTLFGAVVTGIA